MTDHICTCGDCNPGPYIDKCKYELAIARFLEAWRIYPPEWEDETDNAWRVGGAAKRAWLTAIEGMQAVAR